MKSFLRHWRNKLKRTMIEVHHLKNKAMCKSDRKNHKIYETRTSNNIQVDSHCLDHSLPLKSKNNDVSFPNRTKNLTTSEQLGDLCDGNAQGQHQIFESQIRLLEEQIKKNIHYINAEPRKRGGCKRIIEALENELYLHHSYYDKHCKGKNSDSSRLLLMINAGDGSRKTSFVRRHGISSLKPIQNV